MLQCPHCRSPVADSPDLAGQTVACPNCAKHFTMPAAVSIVAPQAIQSRQPLPFQQQQPMVFVQTSAPRQPRLQAGGWFARSFASASGVVLAVLLILFGGTALAVLMVCGGMA